MKTTEITAQIKELILLNIASEDFRYIPGEFGKNDNGKWGFLPDWENISQIHIDRCIENLDIIAERQAAREKQMQPLVGDYLVMSDGTSSRITHLWNDSVQDGGGSGSFYLSPSGHADYSGGLNSAKPRNKIVLTSEKRKAKFWIFGRNIWGANRGFYFYIDVKVWKIIGNYPKTAYVKFENYKYNYHTTVSGKLSDDEIKSYFVGKKFNLGHGDTDDVQTCIDCAVFYDDV